MKRFFTLFCMATALISCSKAEFAETVLSPAGKVSFSIYNVSSSDGNALAYDLSVDGQCAVRQSLLGFVMNGVQYGANAGLRSEKGRTIDESYELLCGKKMSTRNHCNESIFSFRDKEGKKFDVQVRVFDDGAAFRYIIPGKTGPECIMDRELTEFALPEGKAWIHPYDWNGRHKPSYEQYSVNGKPVGTKSTNAKGWAFPMLFQTEGLWTMVTEACLDGTYPACHIDNSGTEGAYRIRFPEMEEPIIPDDPRPSGVLPWETPWRVIISGKDLNTIFSTQMVQHLNPPCSLDDVSWIKPGKAAWSWWYKGGTTRSYETQIKYVDFINQMNWPYSLIDSGWPRMDGEGMESVVRYANEKGAGIWLWYHSGAGDADGVMSNPERRREEMKRISGLGVKGIKVDFFDTDKQGVIKLYPAILKDAAEFHLMVDLHGATLPRGFERTYPNLMTTEAIRGAESLGRQEVCDRAAEHNATVVFTRNVVGSMDYTPVTFSNKIRQGVEAFRRTSMAHQIALSVVFESGFHCFADCAEAYLALPDIPRGFLMKVPTAWDESILLAGYPSDYAVVARRCGNTWYIAGINGKNETRTVTFPIPEALRGKTALWIADGQDINSFDYREMTLGESASLDLLPGGGFASAINL